MVNRERLHEVQSSTPDTPKLLVVRHGEDDESIIDGRFDNGLLHDGVPQVAELASEIASFFKESGEYGDVRLLHSSKLRAYQSAAVITQRLSQAGISSSMKRVDELRELYQGELALSDDQSLEDRAEILRGAWRAYATAVEVCDLWYRFGDPDVLKHAPQISKDFGNSFTGYGENQYEFTQRIYRFTRDILQYDFGASLPVIVAHRATVTKIQRIMGACSMQDDSVDAFKPGELRFVERDVPRTKVGHAEGVILPLSHRKLARNVLERELVYLHTLQPGQV